MLKTKLITLYNNDLNKNREFSIDESVNEFLEKMFGMIEVINISLTVNINGFYALITYNEIDHHYD